MWLAVLVSILLALLVVAYIYGLLSPIALYRDKLLSPHLLYFSY